MAIINIRAIVIKEINRWLQSKEFKELLKEKIEQIYSEESSEIKGILSMKRYILTDNGCILDTVNIDCRIYAEEDGTMVEWKDKVYNKDSSDFSFAVVKDKIIKESDKMVRLIVYREFYLNKKEAEEIAMKVADEECYSDLIDCTTKEDYEKFIEKWEDQISE